MIVGRWERFCVVGIGGHARTKLIPAILANGQTLAGVVTRKLDGGGASAPCFSTLAEALAGTPADTVFVIASPPAVHFSQVVEVLRAGRDVIVEKPAFTSAANAREATRIAEATGAILVEGFMNRYTATHRRFLAAWARQRPASVDFTFTIPQAPDGTFRSDPAIGASNLYDMGCYPLAALSDAGVVLNCLELEHVERPGQPDRELLHLAGILDGVTVRLAVGVDWTYTNRLALTWADGASMSWSPFIYGRPGQRLVTTSGNGEYLEEQIDDCNAFEAMFAQPRSRWRQSQVQRSAQIIELATQLERLGAALAAARAL